MPNSLPRLLYVDDDAGSRTVVDEWLNSKQDLYAATVVSTAAEAAEHIAAGRFDLYILACSDVEADKSELCSAIRTKNTDVPVILYSSRDGSADLRRATTAGVDLCINKPGDLDVLKAAIPLLLGRSWSRESRVAQ